MQIHQKNRPRNLVKLKIRHERNQANDEPGIVMHLKESKRKIVVIKMWITCSQSEYER